MEDIKINAETLESIKREEGKPAWTIKCRIDLDNKIYERYLSLKAELKKRDAGYFGISQFINELLAEIPKEADETIIERRTPLEFELRSLLENDGHRKKLEKLISKL